MSYTYKYPRPSVTVDCVIFGLDEEELKVLLIQRKDEPFRGCWAFPGGFVDMDESIDRAAMRELQEETSLENIFMEQLYTFGEPERDPRGRVISVAYFALVNIKEHRIEAQSDAENVGWFSINDIPPLAFDHDKVFDTALNRLKGKVRYQPIGFELLPHKFTLSQLQKLYEQVLEVEFDKRNFRKKILKMNILVELDEIQKDVSHRAARLYMFDEVKYKEYVNQGFNFEV